MSVSSAGDMNGDGIDDMIVGAPAGDNGGPNAGEAYVIFGQTGAFGTVDLTNFANGFILRGEDGVFAGRSVAAAGDVNGDGFADIVIGAPYADGGGTDSGAAYVVFGKPSGLVNLVLPNLNGSNGFVINGADPGNVAGSSVSSAGDVNGDGFADMIVGAPQSVGGGKAFVIFGKATPGQIDLSTIDPEDGLTITGDSTGDRAGWSVSSAGDVNGDGFDDIILGAHLGTDGVTRAGEAYVIFGKSGGFADIDLTGFSMANADGFLIRGDAAYDDAGRAVSSAGDINGDGFDDMMVGAPLGDDGGAEAGEAYVLYGEAPSAAVRRVGAAGDRTIRGGDFDDTLSGLGGDDTLDGGGGRDRIIGGTGKDRILLESTSVADADTIFGFNPGKDKLLLDGSVYGLPEGSLNPSHFVVGNQVQDANDRLIYKPGVGKLYFDPDGNGAARQQLIATLSGAPVLGAGDFVVI